VTIFYTEGAPEQLPMLSKREVAELLLDRILVRLDSRGAAPEAAVEEALTPTTEATT
jgi:hypothetical protein